MSALPPSDGIILRRIKHGDRNQIITIFTQEHGKITAYARGARGMSKRFGGKLDLFQLGGATFGRRRQASAMPVLSEFQLQTGYIGIRTDIVKFAIASFWAELVLTTSADHDPSPVHFTQLCDALATLEQSPLSARRDLILGFQLQWFDSMGVLPPLDEEALGRANLPPLSERSLSIARALVTGVSIEALNAHYADEVGTLTRSIRQGVLQKPMSSAQFLHQVLTDPAGG
jgi:DNA repair protein RecO (recombination protein O)